MKSIKSRFLTSLPGDRKINDSCTSSISRIKKHCNKKIIFVLVVMLFNFLTSLAVFAADEKSAVPAPASASAVKIQNGATAPGNPKDTTQIVVSFIINTVPKGDYFTELDDKQNLFIRVEDAKTMKLQYPDNKIVILRGDEQYIPLSAFLDVTATFDEKKLTVVIIGKTMESGKTAVDLFSLQSTAKNIYYPRETSAFINYGVNYIYNNTGGFQSFGLTNKLGFRTGDVFITSDSLYTKTENSDNFVRLQSSATYERKKDLQWVVFGDQYANSGDLGSTVNMGGIGLSKVYRMDPYFMTQPVMDLKGSVIFPTQAEIYMDGVLIGKQTIIPGSFELKNLYSYTGSHNVQVLLKDPFGNVQKIDYLAYFSSQMLRQGLHEYSYNAGFLRENYGVDSDQYGKAVFSMFHRYGVTNNFNIGARAEGSDGIYNGGLSTAFAIPRFGQLTLTFAGSSAVGNDLGGALLLKHSYQLGSFSSNLLLRGYSRDYATVGSSLLMDTSQYEMNLGLGYMIPVLGSFSVNYAETSTFKGTDTRVISANYSRTIFKKVSLFTTASATHTSTDTTNDMNYGFFAGLNFDLWNNIHGSAQVSAGSGGTNTETLQVQKDMPVGEGLGYRASVNSTQASSGAARTTTFNPYVQYNAKYGIYSLDATVQNSGGVNTESYNLSAAGSAVYAGGFFGLSRPVSDSFGIVMINKVPNATILNNGQDMGKTGSSGTLVVPTLSSYGRNQVTLDTKNLPMDYSVSDVNRIFSPSMWSGSCISYDAQQSRALTGTLVAQKEGKKKPLEYVLISMKIAEKMVTFPTGKGGEFYMEDVIPAEQKEGAADQKENASENLSCRAIAEKRKSGGNIIKPGTYRAVAEYEDGKCEFNVTFPDTKDAITDVGEIQCNGESAPVSAPVSTPVAPPVPSIQEPPAKDSLLHKNRLYYEKNDEVSMIPSGGSPPLIRGPSPPASPPQVSEGPPAVPQFHSPKDVALIAAEQKQEKVSFILRVQFEKAVRYAFDKRYSKSIRKLADFMKAHPETSIEIIGHTANSGKEGYDMLLSQKRADSVRRYLVENFGIEKSRVHALGYGASQPIILNKSKTEQKKNERIEIVIYGLQAN